MPDNLEWEWHACDIRPDAVEKLRLELPGIHSHPDSVSMLKEKAHATDIVIVCTPPDSHAHFVREALVSGRHVLCEKPLFLDALEATKVESQLTKSNGLLMACCSNRFAGRSSIAAAKSLIAEGRIGTVYRLRWIDRKHRSRTGIEYLPGSRWFLDRSKSGGGVGMDWGPYDIAVLDALLRPSRMTVVSCLMQQVETGAPLETGTVFDVETQVIAQINYELPDGSNVRVDYERTSATHGREESLFEVEGSRGAINLSWIWSDEARLFYDRDGTVITEEIPLKPETASVHDRPLLDLIRSIRGAPSLTIANADALFNFRCLRALYEAHVNGYPVTVQRQATTF